MTPGRDLDATPWAEGAFCPSPSQPATSSTEPHQLSPSKERMTLVPRSLLTSCLCKLHPLPPVRKEGREPPPTTACSPGAPQSPPQLPQASNAIPGLLFLTGPWPDDQDHCSLHSTTAALWLVSPPLRGLCAQTTFSPSPTKEAPLSLGELLSWFSEVSKSRMSSAGGPDAAAFPLLLSPTKRCWMSISTSFPVAADLVPQCWGKWDSTEDSGRPFPPPFAAAVEQLAGAVASGQGPVRRGQG